MEKKLNLDIAGSVTEFEALIKEFLIGRIIYKIIVNGTGRVAPPPHEVGTGVSTMVTVISTEQLLLCTELKT